MKITEYLSNANRTLFSFEILPPLKGRSIESIYAGIEPLLEFEPAFIDVTYHREEFVYKKHPNGLLEKISVRKRPGTVGICAAIMNKYKIEAVPHLICGGFSMAETENALIDLHYLGIDNVLVLRGDSIKTEPRFLPEVNGHSYACDLLAQVKNMNKGLYMDEDLTGHMHTDFCVGVAGYPEKHFEAPNMASDMKYLKIKADNGADYIVTQMFFDNSKFFEFVTMCREAGIGLPIIPGLKPLTSKAQVHTLPSIFHVDIPFELTERIEQCKNEQEVKEAGVEWCIKQSRELMEFGVPCLHYYTMGKSETTKAIARAIF
jgi:methylenetetrahydrofolate reductase (NADPH)